MIFENAPGRAEQPLVIAPGDQPNCDRIASGDIRSQIEIGAGFIIQLELRNHFGTPDIARSEEHTSELQSLMRISYAVFCLKNKHKMITKTNIYSPHALKEQNP